MAHHDIDCIATQLRLAQDEVRQLVPLISRRPDFGMDDGYAVANRIHQTRSQQGAAPAGRKIGFTNAAMWSRYGVQEPVWGHMYAHAVVNMDDRSGIWYPTHFTGPGIEPEIAVHFFSGTA